MPPQAEAFAALVLIDFVSISGATQTIMTLLKKPDNRCAAITMLGKTIELCHEQARAARFKPQRAMPLAFAELSCRASPMIQWYERVSSEMCCTRQPALHGNLTPATAVLLGSEHTHLRRWPTS